MKDYKKYLVDSNIIIYYLNGEKKAIDFIANNIKQSSISRLTFLEVLTFNFTKEKENQVIRFLKKFTIIDTSENITNQALKNRKIKKIKLADNIIASSAQVNDLTLVTRNTKDFNSIDVKILNPFENE